MIQAYVQEEVRYNCILLKLEITGIKQDSDVYGLCCVLFLHKIGKIVKCCSISLHFVDHLLDYHLGGPDWESTENKILRLLIA